MPLIHQGMPDIRKAVVVCLLVFFAAGISAMPDDRKQIVRLLADKVDLNQSTREGTYTGHMEFDQGTTHLRADKAITRVNEQNQLVYAVAFSDSGKQVHYWEQTDPNKPLLHAYADEIRYHPLQHLIELLGHAHITQGSDSFTAPEISFNTEKKHVIARGNKHTRTQIIIHPEKKHE